VYRQRVGTFQVAIDVGDPSGQRFAAIEALVFTAEAFRLGPASQPVTIHERAAPSPRRLAVARWHAGMAA